MLNRSRKIAIVIHSLGGGGAERTLVDLTASWASRGDQVSIITLSHALDDAYALHPAVTRVVLDVAGESKGIFNGIVSNVRRVLIACPRCAAWLYDDVVHFGGLRGIGVTRERDCV